MKAHELEGAALALAVAQCVDDVSVHDTDPPYYYGPPLTWERCGPIIERERIAIYFADESPRTTEPWVAGFCLEIDQGQDWGGDTGPESASLSLDYSQTGPTPLIAAMRAYIAMMASTRKLEGVD